MGNILKKNKHNKTKMYSNKKNKSGYNYKIKPEVVKIIYYNEHGNKVCPGENVKYSYIYKGVPGGWYVK